MPHSVDGFKSKKDSKKVQNKHSRTFSSDTPKRCTVGKEVDVSPPELHDSHENLVSRVPDLIR